MTKRWGATAQDWLTLTVLAGLTTELLPVVSNPNAIIAPTSTLSTIGKVPSIYDRARQVVGIARWTSRRSTMDAVSRWERDADLGICIQSRTIRAIDIDITRPDLVERVRAVIDLILGRELPRRYRADSSKCLLAFRLPGPFTKRVLRTADGIIEFLADGQQFIAAGTHPAGERYQWDGGLPDDFPTLTDDEFNEVWQQLEQQFAVEGGIVAKTTVNRLAKQTEAMLGDPVAQHLINEGWLLSTNRDGSINIRCPFEAEHTAGVTESATTYWPAHTGGFQRGHFKCLHAHCAKRNDHDFMQGCGFYAAEFPALTDAPGDVGPDGEIVPISFERNSKTGRVIANLHNLKIALSHEEICGAAIVYDTFREELQIAWGKLAPRPMSDQDAVTLRRRLEREVSFQPVGREMMRDALVELEGYRRIDSGKAWLESLVWDGVPRIEKFFPTYAATDDTAYTRAVGLYAWTAHAGRVMDPGCQADMAIVLVGDQGRGKTSLMKALVPLVDQYVELGLDVHNNDLARLMRGKLIGELAELKGIAGREMEAVKAWITRRVEEWTPKYRERTQSMPRRLVLWGSTNIERFLDDATGERRWLPATVGAIDVVAAKADRDQLWAEGLAMWKRHGVMWQDAERLATAVHEDHKMIDPWEEQIETFAQTCGLEGQKRGDQGFTMTELLTEGLGLKAAQITKAVEMRAAKALKRHGFDRRMLRVEGQRAWRWYAQDFADIC